MFVRYAATEVQTMASYATEKPRESSNYLMNR